MALRRQSRTLSHPEQSEGSAFSLDADDTLPMTSPLGPVPGLGYASPISEHAVHRIEDGKLTADRVHVADEVPVAFVYNGRSHVVVMASPTDLEDLAIGFSFTEGIVERAGDVGRVDVVRHSRGIELQIDIPPDRAALLEDRRRGMSMRSGCGLCGVEALEEVLRLPPPIDSVLTMTQGTLWRAAETLEGHQPINLETRTVHAGAWYSVAGDAAIVREDVGRHNALDKVIGALLKSPTDPSGGFLIVTSRASYELILKAAITRVPLLAAVSRPTGLAIRIADELGLTLVGLLRGRSAIVYTHPQRIP
jgi:FdhD protein